VSERELTFHERAVWGRCSTCGAEDGKRCDPNVGIPLVDKLGNPVHEGVHLARLNNAPRRVREVPA